MDNYYGSNVYINKAYGSAFTREMKEQEREAILKMLDITRDLISYRKESLDTKLDDQETGLKKLATKKLVSNFKEGLIGSAADAAERQLTTDEVFKPDFENPIKG